MDPVFEQALQKIPAQLRERPGTRFTVIINGQKKPEGKDWEGNGANYAIGDAILAGYLAEGHNYGVLCGHAGIAVPDLDDPSALEQLGILERIPVTFKVLSGRGGFHVYFDCPELDHQIGLYHPALKDEDGEPLHLGEIQSLGQQVVGPGSIHPNGNRYEVINDSPIMTISKADLLKIFDGLILTGIDDPTEEPRKTEARRRKSCSSLLGDYIAIDLVAWPKNIKERTGSEVRGSQPLHGSDSGKNFAVNTAKNCWHCFRCDSGGGPLEWLAVEAGLISCKEAKPRCLEDKALFKKVLQIAKDRGFNIPDRPFDLLERIKSDPRILKEAEILAALAALKVDDPIEYDILLESIKKTGIRIKVATITGLVNEYADRCKAAVLNKDIDHDKKAISAAREILECGDPLQAHVDYVNGKVCGGEKPARVIILSSYSAYLSNNDRLYADIVGSPQSGKSTNMTTVLETFPEENVLITSEASPKSLYYLAQQQPERLQDAIIYIDDARSEHIPVLKTFRNEGNVRPTNLTVADGEFLELVVQYRPVVLASSVTPLRDLEGQATSRAFLVSVPDASPEEEIRVREKIRLQISTNALLSQKNDTRQKTLQEMARILRDEGVRDVLIPFDVKEPQGADRRGTGQFMRLIKVSAFINQFQRPIIELKDGRKFVLSIYDDFVTAAGVWFDFAEGQKFKLSSRVLEVLRAVPDQFPGKTAPTIAREMDKGQRSIERYLEDLYEAGIASREKISAPGMPWGYWVEPATRQKVLAQIPESLDAKTNSVTITTEKMCREYMAKNSSESLKDSYINFFSNNDMEIKKMDRGGKVSIAKETVDGLSSWVYSFTPLFSQKSCRDSGNAAMHSETVTISDLSQFAAGLLDSDLENVANHGENVAILAMSKRDMPTPMKKPGGETMGELVCYRARLRSIAIAEYGMWEWVDPAKIASEVGLLECQTLRGLEHLEYERFDRPDGSIGYRQKKMARSPGKAEA